MGVGSHQLLRLAAAHDSFEIVRNCVVVSSCVNFFGFALPCLSDFIASSSEVSYGAESLKTISSGHFAISVISEHNCSFTIVWKAFRDTDQ